MLKWARFGAQPARTAILTISRQLTLTWTYPRSGCPWRSQPQGLHTDPFITMSRYVSFRDFDWWLLLFVLIICGLGVLEIRSATAHTKFAGAHVKQMYWIGAAQDHDVRHQLPQLSGAARQNPLALYRFAGLANDGAGVWTEVSGGPPLDQDARGAHFQPSEWVKLILIIAVAKYFTDLSQRELTWPDFIKAGAIVGIPMLMVLVQPDLGTALTYLPIAIMGLFLGGLRLRQALIVILLGVMMLPLAWHHLKPYQRERLTSFSDPESDSQGSGYQVNQSLIAVGSGGLWGSAAGSQTHLAFPPYPPNRLHFCRFFRRAWICRRVSSTAAILYSADAFDAECANGARPRWRVHGDGCGGGA